MEERCSVNSPRRILSFSRNRRSNVSFPDVDDGSPPGFGVSGEHGPKLSEVYGFVGSITTVVATVVLIIWAYVPDHWLHSVGICYYPSRYWALAVPTYLMVTIVLAIGFYIGMNFMATPPPTSLNTMFDEFSREPLTGIPSTDDDDQPIEPISDIGINQINDIMFRNLRRYPPIDVLMQKSAELVTWRWDSTSNFLQSEFFTKLPEYPHLQLIAQKINSGIDCN